MSYLSPEAAVRYAVASAALEGVTIDAQWQQVLLAVARDEVTADEAIGMAIDEYHI